MVGQPKKKDMKREELEILLARYEAYCGELTRIIELNKITET